MKVYRTYVTVTDPQRIVLANVPFQPGQRVEILVIAEETEHDQSLTDLDAAFKATQALPSVQALSDAEIDAEISAWRSGQ